jgi:hypothetical protein
VMNLADTCQSLNFAKLVSLRDRAGGAVLGLSWIGLHKGTKMTI